ncbi:RcnB family protein [Sphingomonas lacunae]|uniref:RcnB family protein n=1 Tax=Sphingomonas lacunae TaxID=2698828 RepID=A0A6M4AVB4_9SPHN|nr:RcnB family protein [Sphingomonas lacunae]QJQ32350.1 RcnB family protein [Sphingomonas lacunae]
MTSRWFGTLLIVATALTPLSAVQAQDSLGDQVRAQARAAAIAATSGGIHSVDLPASTVRSTPAMPSTNSGDFQRRGRGDGGGWGGRGGGGGRSNDGGGWGGPTASPTPSPTPSAPSAGGWRGRGDGNGGGWRGRAESAGDARGGGYRARVNNDAGGWRQPRAERPVERSTERPATRGDWGGRRGDGNRWQPPVSSTTTTASPAPADSGRWQGRDRYRQGDATRGYERRGGNRAGDWNSNRRTETTSTGYGQRVIRNAERTNGGNRYDNGRRYDDNRWDRRNDDRWDRNRWDRRDGNRYDNNRRWDRRDNDRYAGRYGNRGHGNWDRSWRNDRRYDWQSHRTRYSSFYRLPRYYSPYRDWSYRRLHIGFNLWPLFYAEQFWINDPWYYRLPDVYGPYRWVRYYDDALLVDITTGQVVDVIENFFW